VPRGATFGTRYVEPSDERLPDICRTTSF